MIVPVPVLGRSYTCTVSGRTFRTLKCFKCATDYVYLMERKVTGDAAGMVWVPAEVAEQRARESAIRSLEHALSKDCELVACPDCGHYQPDMIRKIRTTLFLFVFAAWAFLCLGVWIAYIGNDPDSAIDLFIQKYFVGLIVLAVVLLALGVKAIFVFDPNRTAANRKAREKTKKSRAIRKADFDAKIALQAREREKSQLVEVPNVHCH